MTIKKGREDVTDVADRPLVVGFCRAKRKETNNIKLLHELERHPYVSSDSFSLLESDCFIYSRLVLASANLLALTAHGVKYLVHFPFLSTRDILLLWF